MKLSNFTCALPKANNDRIMLAHGSGGTSMHQLLDTLILPALFSEPLANTHDAAVLNIAGAKLAFTTDSYVVDPLFFPGGDIGSLSVHGTINDLAMSGAVPLYISVAFILEEGLAITQLQQILASIRAAADAANVRIVTGDTKVVERGKGHGIYINTAGVGIINHQLTIDPRQLQAGDVIIINGDIGRHGIAIMAQREGLEFATTIESDSAPLAQLVAQLLAADINIHCLRDITRGGLATTLNELAISSNSHIKLDEVNIPIQAEVQSACELLGLDVMHVACEGRLVVVVPELQALQTLAIMRQHQHGALAQIIGVVTNDQTFTGVTMTNYLGIARIVDKLAGEQLPRIC